MSLHKLTAGSGYDYLTRQVAVQDVTEKGHTSLASYYTAHGEAPGTWLGSGLEGIGGLAEGDAVTAEQMRNLFGAGKHPLAEQIRAAAAAAGLDAGAQEASARLGVPFRVYTHDTSVFRIQVAREIAALNASLGRRSGDPVSLDERARIRTQVAVELFRAEYGRDPVDAREVAATIAKHSRPRTNAVAGFDLTFSPVKSVSALWAIAPTQVAAQIERAHRAAVKDALAYLERTALFTREGTGGVRQVEVRGLVAAAFTHRDSRAGDPDLHTHVAVANKVQTRDGGRWLAIDGRLLFAATVAASETYNTMLERHLTDSLGLRFAARDQPRDGRRPVREVVGIDSALTARWSTRRADIEARRAELAATFQATHGRPPTPVESVQLAEQATLETREAKHGPRSLAQQRTSWAAEARAVLGGERGVREMVTHALRPSPTSGQRVDSAWIRNTAGAVVATMEAHRSSWQRWHVEAEALRRVRDADLPTRDVNRVVGLLVDEALTRHSVSVAPAGDGIASPDALARTDGSSVYEVAGSTRFTSAALLDAEARIVASAGRHDGTRATTDAVDVALAESAAAGLPLNAGQAALVREMVTSGARVQLAIAPAGAGKTTAMRALTAAWTTAGGEVVGLAPSAAAAAVLGEAISAPTDTMAKLLWHLDHDPQTAPEWAEIGPASLVVVDEAGMADTISLDRLIGFVTDRGGSVRLIGDDQQLAAIGAGGVLRDIRATHGALHLTELMRFADPAEGAASLALREGLPESLGFYLDRGRVHVGDQTTLTDQVFDAWRHDSHAGHDTIMLAPTRELVSELNRRARAHRLGEARPTDEVALTDGDQASVGDTVITRANNRRLRLTATDWVKNGDRWQVTAVHPSGDLTVRHAAHGRSVRLPADYVRSFVTLGYASTIHTVQGVTADTSHTLLTGEESRQLAYTALTRGKAANHLYLEVVDDGDPHNVIRPEHVHPLTATDLLERIVARDESATSAHTERRLAEDPATLLGEAAARYADSLTVAAEQLLGHDAVARLDQSADHLVPGLADAPAWPSLRAHLLVLAAQDGDPLEHLRNASDARELTTAGDVAATLDWRLDETGLRNAGAGPLPWLPGIPTRLGEDPEWGPYLAARAARVRDLTDQVAARARAEESTPVWARTGQRRPETDLLADVTVWRAATGVLESDRRPTGARQFAKAAALHQDALDARLARGHTPALAEWAPLLDRTLGRRSRDTFTPVLAERLSALSRAGLNAPHILQRAREEGALPDDHAAAALWWRISRRLTPAVAAEAEVGHALATEWTPRLTDLVGRDVAETLRTSPWWPALVTTIDHAIACGSTVDRLLAGPLPEDDVDPCQALVWRISLFTTDVPDDRSGLDPTSATDLPDEPNPFWQDEPEIPPAAPLDHEWAQLQPTDEQPEAPDMLVVADVKETDPFDDPAVVEAFLSLAAAARAHAGPLPPSERMIQAQAAREFDAATAPVPPARILELNRLAVDYYARQFPGSWAQAYLRDRMRTDLTGDPHVGPGYAPVGWTHLVDHLRREGFIDLELTESGLASVARTGRLIDRFRDRLVLPILRRDGGGTLDPLGFVGRRHPNAAEQTSGPKYLNTSDTPLFHKGAQLFTVRADLLVAGATPVLVEGPMDALAVSLAGQGAYVGVAPLGTALTEEQAAELARYTAASDTSPVVAMDADRAGSLAAQRDYWLLAQHALTPMAVTLRPGSDPADVLDTNGREALQSLIRASTPLADSLITERLDQHSDLDAVRAATQVLAASAPDGWDPGVEGIARSSGVPVAVVRRELARAVQRWADDPRDVASERISELREFRVRAGDWPSASQAPRPTSPDAVTPPPARSRNIAPSR